MRIAVQRYAVTNPRWTKLSERFKVLSKRFCCDAMKDIEEHLRMENKWPPKLTFWLDKYDTRSEKWEINFCPGCGEKVEFVEEVKAA